jgi:hypothetical protein
MRLVTRAREEILGTVFGWNMVSLPFNAAVFGDRIKAPYSGQECETG